MTQENNSKLYIENSSLFIGGNVVSTYADVSGLIDDFGYNFDTKLTDGIGEFVKWYREFYGYIGILDLNICEFTQCNLPRKQKKLVEAWTELHKDELMADWNLAQNGELPFPVDPLK